MYWFSKPKKPVEKTAQDFYAYKALVKTEWWLSSCDPSPDLLWARLRVFSDGTADAAFDSTHSYGFDSETYAMYYLSEDEYIRLTTLDEEDEIELNVQASQLVPPIWPDKSDSFQYIGKY